MSAKFFWFPPILPQEQGAAQGGDHSRSRARSEEPWLLAGRNLRGPTGCQLSAMGWGRALRPAPP